MKIGATETGKTYFSTLRSGDCFKYPKGEQVYMKITSPFPGKYNVVKLDDGCTYYVRPDKQVNPVDVEAVVKEDC